jgi:2-oxoglutarate ferredoxin oxidoreductase subunit beta
MFEHNLMSEGMDVLEILKGAGATFLARHVSMDGVRAVETVKKAIQNNGFSLVHMPYPCPTNFVSRQLGSRIQVNIFRWIQSHAAPLGEEKEDTIWATGIWHDASNSRPEFNEFIWETVEKIRRTGKIRKSDLKLWPVDLAVKAWCASVRLLVKPVSNRACT